MACPNCGQLHGYGVSELRTVPWTWRVGSPDTSPGMVCRLSEHLCRHDVPTCTEWGAGRAVSLYIAQRPSHGDTDRTGQGWGWGGWYCRWIDMRHTYTAAGGMKSTGVVKREIINMYNCLHDMFRERPENNVECK